MALDDVQPDAFLLGGKLGCDEAGVDRLPADECRMCLWCQHQGHTLSPDCRHLVSLRSCSCSFLLLPGWSFLSHTLY